jgi:demethylmenaquinone methyltransferase/2-methoxy-6-polyprenyl-1,4-benzoquinol methylase
MLDLAREKAEDRGTAGIRFEWADALHLPYDAGRFDAVTVGFGVRNFADRDRGIREMARVLRPGGRLVILEFTRPGRFPFSTFYSLWFDRIAPLLGRISDDPDAYAYLAESVRSFPGPLGLAEMMDRGAGLEGIRYSVLAGGIVTIHTGTAG